MFLGEQVFYLHPAQPAEDGDVIQGSFEMVRRSENHRLMNVAFTIAHGRAGPQGMQHGPSRVCRYNIE